MSGPSSPILDALTTDQVQRIRGMNDTKYRGWRARDVVKLHRRTAAAESDGGAAYHAGIHQHLASGLYARIYPPHVVEATRLYLAQAKA